MAAVPLIPPADGHAQAPAFAELASGHPSLFACLSIPI